MKAKISLIFALVLAAIFVYSGAIKIMDPAGFYASIRGYQLLPDDWSWYLAHYLSWLEMVIGLSLLWHRWRAAAALLVSIALLVFIAAIEKLCLH
jgi:uncharacterized membrane protein YphA (DoxX/SURF4 family)